MEQNRSEGQNAKFTDSRQMDSLEFALTQMFCPLAPFPPNNPRALRQTPCCFIRPLVAMAG